MDIGDWEEKNGRGESRCGAGGSPPKGRPAERLHTYESVAAECDLR